MVLRHLHVFKIFNIFLADSSAMRYFDCAMPKTKIVKRIRYDGLLVRVEYPTHGFVELSVTRNRERLRVAGSMHKDEIEQQMEVIASWARPLPNETHGQRAERFADFAARVNSVRELVATLGGPAL